MTLDAAALDAYFEAVRDVNRLSVQLSKVRSGNWTEGAEPDVDQSEVSNQFEQARARRDAALARLGEVDVDGATDPP